MKNINPRLIPYIIITILAIVSLLSISQCNHNKREALSNKGLYDFEHSKVDSFKNTKGLQVAETKPAETYRAEDIKKLSAEVFDLKKSNERMIKQVDAFVKVNQVVRVTDSLIKYYPLEHDPIDTMISIHDCILPPRKFNTENKNYSIAGTVLLDGVKIDSIELNNTVSFRIAEKKEGLFSSKKTVVQVVNSNPYFNTSAIQSIVLKPKQNAWNTWIKPVVFAAGALLIQKQLK